MSKNILLAVVGFGGLVLVTSLLSNNSTDVALDEQVNTVSEISIPADIPTFPMYPNTEVSNVRDTDSQEARDISVSLDTKATKKDIHEWYRAALSQNGWNITSDKNVAGYQIIQAEKDNLYTSLQTANGAEGDVLISQHLKIRN